jgi:putative transposase
MPWRPKVPSPTWRRFLRNHMSDTAAVDMFVVATATFRLLYTVIVLGHDRRRIVHFDITRNPTQARLARQMTEAAPRYLLPDRDGIIWSGFPRSPPGDGNQGARYGTTITLAGRLR